MDLETPYYRLFLKAELLRRCRANPRYSLRAFARSLVLDPSSLSKILSGKMALSARAAAVAVEQLSCSPEQSRLFLESVGDDWKRQRLGERLSASPSPAAVEIAEEQFRILADWYHMAILELTETPRFRADARWIGRQLGINVIEAKLALERLKKMGFLREENGAWKQTTPHTTTGNRPETTVALRRRQRQVLEKAIYSLDNDPIEERTVTCMTMAIDPGKLELARKIISEFNRHLCQVLSSGRRQRVYHLSIGLYPVQKKEVRK